MKVPVLPPDVMCHRMRHHPGLALLHLGLDVIRLCVDLLEIGLRPQLQPRWHKQMSRGYSHADGYFANLLAMDQPANPQSSACRRRQNDRLATFELQPLVLSALITPNAGCDTAVVTTSLTITGATLLRATSKGGWVRSGGGLAKLAGVASGFQGRFRQPRPFPHIDLGSRLLVCQPTISMQTQTTLESCTECVRCGELADRRFRDSHGWVRGSAEALCTRQVAKLRLEELSHSFKHIIFRQMPSKLSDGVSLLDASVFFTRAAAIQPRCDQYEQLLNRQ